MLASFQGTTTLHKPTMKRIPLLFAVLTAAFLMICVIEVTAFPPAPPAEWNPPWWACEYLAQIGWWIVISSFFVLRPMDHLFDRIPIVGFAAFAVALLSIIALASWLVYWLVRLPSVRRFSDLARNEPR